LFGIFNPVPINFIAEGCADIENKPTFAKNTSDSVGYSNQKNIVCSGVSFDKKRGDPYKI